MRIRHRVYSVQRVAAKRVAIGEPSGEFERGSRDQFSAFQRVGRGLAERESARTYRWTVTGNRVPPVRKLCTGQRQRYVL